MNWRIGLILVLALFPSFGQAADQTVGGVTPGVGTPVPGTPIAGGDGIGPVDTVATLTGPDSVNDTLARYNVAGTDLGHSFEHDGALYMVFGDTFGPDQTDWRSNVMAVTTDDDPSDGLTFDRMIEDRPGHAKELIAQEAVPGDEVTIIPTYGIAVGDRMVLHYMAVSYWGLPGHWDLSQSGLAYSDDGGENWTVDPAATWPADTNFAQVAFVERDGWIYAFGIPGGRFGGVALARVQPASILDLSAWEYWDGATWVPGDATAAVINPAPIGELSVRWNSYYGKWLMMYLNEDTYSIVLRTADELTGPWTEERTVVSGEDFPALYAPFIPARWNDGPEIYFTMSLFGPYNVYLMQTSLTDIMASS